MESLPLILLLHQEQENYVHQRFRNELGANLKIFEKVDQALKHTQSIPVVDGVRYVLIVCSLSHYYLQQSLFYFGVDVGLHGRADVLPEFAFVYDFGVQWLDVLVDVGVECFGSTLGLEDQFYIAVSVHAISGMSLRKSLKIIAL